MKTKTQREEVLSELKATLTASEAIVVCKFEGMTVGEDQALRSTLRESGATYRVISNRLARLASTGTPYESSLADQRGMTSLAIPGEDLVGTLKAIVDFAKKSEAFTFTGGVVEGRDLDEKQVSALSKMPGKAGLQAQLLYMINSSAQRLLGVLNAPGRDIAAVLQQGVEKEKFHE